MPKGKLRSLAKKSKASAVKAAEKTRQAFEFGAGEIASRVGHAMGWSKKMVADFRDYLESERFEKDLDELADRLGVQNKDYPSEGTSHWKRCNAKAAHIFKRSGARVLEMMALTALIPKRLQTFAAILGTSVGTIFVAYHCYHIFLARNGRAEPVE